MDFAAWKDRKFVAQALKSAVDADAGQAALVARFSPTFRGESGCPCFPSKVLAMR
jgi:hypothetical protein